jgi:hypothetical protein
LRIDQKRIITGEGPVAADRTSAADHYSSARESLFAAASILTASYWSGDLIKANTLEDHSHHTRILMLHDPRPPLLLLSLDFRRARPIVLHLHIPRIFLFTCSCSFALAYALTLARII